MTAYICGSTGETIEGHDPNRCVACLQAMLAWWKNAVGENHVEQIRNLGHRVRDQRRELARLNEQVAQPPSPISPREAFDAWCSPQLDRWARRSVSMAFRAGWQAARRALSLPETPSDSPSNTSPVSEEPKEPK